MSNIDQIFQGEWKLTRNIMDNSGVLLSKMDGSVMFSPQPPEGALYREMVKNHYKGDVFEGTKEYLYQWNSKYLNIYLSDNRLLASFDKRKLTGVFSSFLCGDDCYQTMFSFLSCDKIVQIVQISGKRKQFQIQTQLLRR